MVKSFLTVEPKDSGSMAAQLIEILSQFEWSQLAKKYEDCNYLVKDLSCVKAANPLMRTLLNVF